MNVNRELIKENPAGATAGGAVGLYAGYRGAKACLQMAKDPKLKAIGLVGCAASLISGPLIGAFCGALVSGVDHHKKAKCDYNA